MTESFSSCEALTTSTDAQGISLFAEQAAAQGITYIVSAGDTGAEGCDNLGETTAVGGISVNVLASTPFTVAVGGTMFNEHGQNAAYWGTNNSAAGQHSAISPRTSGTKPARRSVNLVSPRSLQVAAAPASISLNLRGNPG